MKEERREGGGERREEREEGERGAGRGGKREEEKQDEKQSQPVSSSYTLHALSHEKPCRLPVIPHRLPILSYFTPTLLSVFKLLSILSSIAESPTASVAPIRISSSFMISLSFIPTSPPLLNSNRHNCHRLPRYPRCVKYNEGMYCDIGLHQQMRLHM